MQGELLRDLLMTSKDGDWGEDAPRLDLVPYRVIRGADFPAVRLGEISGIPLRYLDAKTVHRRTLLPNDIIIETAGGNRDRPTGRTLFISERLARSTDHPLTCASFCRFLRVDPKKAVPAYVFWYLQSLYACGHMWQHQVQHTGVARFQYTKFAESTSIPLPDSHTQSGISDLLNALDEKIELNRSASETLETIARTLFKSWFVDFDPVRAKAADSSLNSELMKLFPSTFVETELGAAPCGWKLATLGTLCRRVAMGPFGSDIKTDNFVDSGVPVIRGANLKSGLIDEGFVYLTNEKADELRHANAYRDDIVITHRGTLGQVGIIPRESSFPRYVVSQSQLVLSVDSDLATPRFVFEFLRSAEGQHQLLSNTSQTGVPAISRPTTSVKAMRLILPPIELLRKFQSLIESLAAKQIANNHESRTLLSIRDTVLPKLMSGEIRVKTAEEAVEANA